MNKALLIFLCVAMLASLFVVAEGQGGYHKGGGGGGRYGCMCRRWRCRWGERRSGTCHMWRGGGGGWGGGGGGWGGRGGMGGGRYGGYYRPRYYVCCPRYGPYGR